MTLKTEVFLASAARTPIGKFSGGLSTTPATELGSIALRAAIERSGIDAGDIEYTVMGNVLSAGEGQTPARQASVNAGVPVTSSALTVNNACASSLQAVIIAAQSIQLEEADVIAAGGMENMSLAPHLLMNSRTGKRLGDTQMVDSMIHDGLWCSFEDQHMGNSAETIGDEYEISRLEQDEFAVRSNRLATAALNEGAFNDEIIPVDVVGKRGSVSRICDDEGPRGDSTVEKLAKLKPAFPPGEKVTAGNSSQLSDGAAALIVASAKGAGSGGVDPMARVTGYAHAANDPRMIFDAPRIAVTNLLDKTGSSIDDFDLIEVNEAFAAQALANGKALGWDWDKVNTRGGAIALGHPIGASGARILVSLLYGLRRAAAKKGLAVICHGGGGAVAMSVESL